MIKFIEQGDNISHSGLNEDECLPCPEIGPIQQPDLQLQPELSIIKQNSKIYLINLTD